MFGLMSRSRVPQSVAQSKSIDEARPCGTSEASGLGRQSLVALAAGFVVVTLAAGIFGGHLNEVMAESDDGGARSFLLSEAQKRRPVYAAPVYRTPAYVASAPVVSQMFAPASAAVKKNSQPAARRSVAAASGKSSDAFVSTLSVNASALPQRSVCVRLCDGYHFPIAPTAGGDLQGHEALCSGLCPGAPTRLFVMPSGSERIEDAQSRDGKRYSALPVAFRYTSTSDNTCSCRRDNQPHSTLVSLLRDFTLRQGDNVMTPKGFRVFRGSRQWPYSRSDFQSLAKSDKTRKERAALSSLERATLVANRTTSTNAPVSQPKPVKAQMKKFTPVAAVPGFEEAGKRVRLVGPQAMLAQ